MTTPTFTLTRKELLALAKTRGLKKYSKLSKPDLMALIDNDIKEHPETPETPETQEAEGSDPAQGDEEVAPAAKGKAKRAKRPPTKYNLFLKQRMADEGITFKEAMSTSSELWKAHKEAQASA